MPDFKNILCNHFRCEINFFSITITFHVLDSRFYFVSVLQNISVSLNENMSVSVSISVNEYNTDETILYFY